MRATGSHTVVLDDVFVPDAAVALIRPADVWHPVWNTVVTAAMPLIMLSALSGSITSVRAEEFSDIRTYDAPDVVRDVMLFGAAPEVARTSVMADILGQGFRQSVHMCAWGGVITIANPGSVKTTSN